LSYLLDTNTCIRYLNGQSENVKQRLERLTPDEILLCSVVKAELLYGAAKGAVGERTLARLNRFFSLFNSLAFDDRSAAAYGALRADLERRGLLIGPNDLMIAAIALAYDSILVTHNTREFGRISQLKYEDWE
jgi:tRNA(fMet)-specific endonuclease VapC